MMYSPILTHQPIRISQYNKSGGTDFASKRNHPCLVKSRLAGDEGKDEVVLPQGLEHQLMPKHVAVIADGNKRWAKHRGLAGHQGHTVGIQVFKELAISCSKYGVKVFSGFAFSTENWTRPQREVDFIMNLAGERLASDMEYLAQKENAKISFIGNKKQFSENLENRLREVEEQSKNKTGLHLVIALNYSGQYDIVEASRKIATKVKDGAIRAQDIDPTLFQQHLKTNVAQFPNPDLVIRTSGGLRISNFMLWQLAYSELYFTEKMFPDFDETDLVQAFTEFQRRQRRFGGHKY